MNTHLGLGFLICFSPCLRGLSTGGRCLGEVSEYTPGMGGCEEGEGKGAKMYGVVGITDGPGCVSTLMLVDVVAAGAENGVLEEVSDDEDEGEVKAEVITQLVPSSALRNRYTNSAILCISFRAERGVSFLAIGHSQIRPQIVVTCQTLTQLRGWGWICVCVCVEDQSFCHLPWLSLSINKHYDGRIAQAHDVT